MNLFFLLVFRQLGSVCVSRQNALRNMAERTMSNVMEQSSVLNKLHLVGIQAKRPSHQTSHMGNAQRMIEPRVDRARVDEIGQGELTDSSQALQCARSD